MLTAVAPAGITEVRHVTRWNRCKLNHIFNVARGIAIHPTGEYLGTVEGVQDSTWRVDGVNNPSLACPNDNSGNIYPNEVYNPNGYVWSK